MIALLSNLFTVMGLKDQEHLSGQQQKLCMKLAYSVIDQFQSNQDLVTIFTRLITEDQNMKSVDMSLSILISSFIKVFVQRRGNPADETDCLLVFVIDYLFPKILDIMADDAPHILNIT